jgi:hypothetical protein
MRRDAAGEELSVEDLIAIMPKPTAASKSFWEACDRGELLLPHCLRCDRIFYYRADTAPTAEAQNWTRAR